MLPYLTADEAKDRLLRRYLIKVDALSEGDMEAASNEIDAMRPFLGWRYSLDPATQPRQFPRNIEPDQSFSDGTVPEPILDAVSLLAYSYYVDEGPPVKQESAGGVAAIYAYPKRNLTNRRIEELIRPYMRKRGQTGHYRPWGERETLENPYLDYYPL